MVVLTRRVFFPPTSCGEKVMGHNPYRQHVTARDGHITDKAAQVLGVIPPNSGGSRGMSTGSRVVGGYRRGSVGRGPQGRGPRSMVEEEVSELSPETFFPSDTGVGYLVVYAGGFYPRAPCFGLPLVSFT